MRGKWTRNGALGTLTLALAATPAIAGAAERCALPASFAVEVEQRGLTDEGGSGLVALALPGSALEAGDRIRQANGTRVERCRELESVAAEAAAKGVALLLGVERGTSFTAVAAVERPVIQTAPASAARAEEGGESVPAPAPIVAPGMGVAAATAPADAPPPAQATAPADAPARGPAPAEARPSAPAAPERSPAPRVDSAALPPHASASTALRRATAIAAAALTNLDQSARLSVPLVLYERRLLDAETTIAALGFDAADGGPAVAAVVEETLDYHRTAREVRRAKIDHLSRRQVDRRAANANSMPYFSNSRVPEWVATYPFLQASLREAPREMNLPIPGEVAGRWDPDQALELLWSRARSTTERLAAWARED